MDFLHNLFKKKKYALGDAVEGLNNKQFNEVKKGETTFNEARLENWYPYLSRFQNWEMYVPQTWVVKIYEQVKLRSDKRKTPPIDIRWFLSVLKSVNYKQYIECLARFVKIHEDKKKGNNSTDIPPLIRKDWADILETQQLLTIKSKKKTKKIRTRKHSTGNKVLD